MSGDLGRVKSFWRNKRRQGARQKVFIPGPGSEAAALVEGECSHMINASSTTTSPSSAAVQAISAATPIAHLIRALGTRDGITLLTVMHVRSLVLSELMDGLVFGCES
ncbi:hypothetical protein [Leifsonia sp. Root112D2]|uniref:hypothetical protein n=1 Tax=Leifsonia sp. Root112D2 TaxID=1736426 RepID=UPI0006FDC055|nr:hypothetical protein [Leifsonia sp. Root112D2]KQV07088.1 hypothetical protein ASC63_07090 [Leifsonia sp. Root112D2]